MRKIFLYKKDTLDGIFQKILHMLRQFEILDYSTRPSKPCLVKLAMTQLKLYSLMKYCSLTYPKQSFQYKNALQ